MSLALSALEATRANLIESISKEVVWRNRDGQSTTWFHPKACVVPGTKGEAPVILMTLQSIGGSDYFGPVHWSESRDGGNTWSNPIPLHSLGRRPVPDHPGLQMGVCDVVPQYHPKTGYVLAIGQAVFYRGERFSRDDQLSRYPVYAVRRPDGTWSEAQKLEWNDPRGSFIYSNNCGQRLNLPDGDILLAFTFGDQESNRAVAGVRCSFDGERLQVKQVGPPLSLQVKRGLLEPSLADFDGNFYLTIRAEDGRGYHSVSADGLHWEPKRPWTWDDGAPLEMSSTQQHWVTHSQSLYLVYTRKNESNVNVIRWRSPLFIARFDSQRRCLIRDTERVVLPLAGNGVDDPDQVALMGNFHVANVNPWETLITVGEWLPRREARGDLLVARIRWSESNRLNLSPPLSPNSTN